jgi:hypothetical protein
MLDKLNTRKYILKETVTKEEAPANSVAGGGVDMAPNAKRTKIFMKRKKLDGRSKEYREAVRRIKERKNKLHQKEVEAKLGQFGIAAMESTTMDNNKKYLETKPGSIEDAVMKALNPNTELETLTLPKTDEEEELKEYIKSDGARRRVNGGDGRKTTAEDNTNDEDDDGEGLDKVQPKAVKKKFKDRKDKDIDNDGDVDDSDEYLHKRRKAISAKMKESRKNFKQFRSEAYETGTDEYANYTKEMTPGEAITNKDARKADANKKKEQAAQQNQMNVDELSNKTMDSYAQKATASQASAEKKGDYRKADKRMAGKMRASRRKFSNDTNKILRGLNK